MNAFSRLITALFTGLAAAVLVTTPALAQDMPAWLHTGELVTIGPDEVVNQNLSFYAGETVEILGTVNGDVYVGGGMVIIDGTINGDLFVAGGSINLNGAVTQDLRLAGGQVNIDGTIGRNATIAGGNVNIGDNAIIQGSVLSFAGNQIYQGRVDGDIITFSGNLLLSDQVQGNIDAMVESLRVNPSALIGGYLTYNDNASAQIDDSATIGGEVSTRHIETPKGPSEEEFAQAGAAIGFGFTLVTYISALILGLLLHRLFPVYMKQSAAGIISSPFKHLGVGLVTIILMPVLAIIFMITIFGFPIGLLTFVSFFIILYLAKFYSATAVGQLIAKRVNPGLGKFWQFFIGLTVVYLVFLIPVIGGLTKLFVTLFGVGALVVHELALYRSLRDKKLI